VWQTMRRESKLDRRKFVVRSKSKPKSNAELEVLEAQRDLAEDILQAVREMKANKVHVVISPVIEARKKTGLSQSQL